MQPRNAICLVIDRFHAGMLGPYGNSWIRTPELNRLASEAFLFDQAYIDSPNLSDAYHSYWLGCPRLLSDESAATPFTLPRALAEAGIETALVTDEPSVAQHPLAAEFGERIFVEQPPAESLVDEIEETQQARFFAAAIEWLAADRGPFFLWLHSRGFAGAWDAPFELRDQYTEEGDPSPPDFFVPPSHWLPEDYDPDELLGINHAYAGQASLVDACVGALLAAEREGRHAANTAVVLLSPRGFPLGEHRHVGPCDEPQRDDLLYNEIVQFPWMMRFPDGDGAAARSQALVAPADLAPTLLDWWKITAPAISGGGRSLLPIVRGEVEAVRDRLRLRAEPDQRALRTAAWYLRLTGLRESPKVELYGKPGDRWEVNEVSVRLPEITAPLIQALEQIEQTPPGTPLPAMDDSLVNILD